MYLYSKPFFSVLTFACCKLDAVADEDDGTVTDVDVVRLLPLEEVEF